MSAHDSVGAESALLDVCQVHGAAAPATQPPGATEDLRKTAVQVSTHRENSAMAAISARHRVTVAEHVANTNVDRLLALAEVRASPDEVPAEEALHVLLKEPNRQHLGQQVLGVFGRTVRQTLRFKVLKHVDSFVAAMGRKAGYS
jgi:hypothetical protein